MRRLSNLFVATVALVLGPAGLAVAQKVPAAVSARVAQSVVEVTASQCRDGKARTGSGFVFFDRRTVVTANHVIAGCRAFRVFFERAPGRPSLDAKGGKALPHADLATIRLQDSAPAVPILSPRAGQPAAGVSLAAIGFPLNSPTLTDLDVELSIGSSVLRDMLPPGLRNELTNRTRIDINGRILRFKRPLLPGMSGGPIVDADGKVVAVVAGGLRSGAAPVSWGWPATHLAALRSAGIDLAENQGARPASLFATTKSTVATIERRCGGLVFERRETVSFKEMAETTDDLAGVMAIVAISRRPRAEIDAARFDLWRHAASGATVVVPAGRVVEERVDGCAVRSASGQFEQIIRGVEAPALPDSQNASLRFEDSLRALYPSYRWIPDLQLTKAGPWTRADGFVVNRKGAYGVSLTTPRATHVFETIMARAGTFTGVATVNHRMGGQYLACVNDPAAAGCGAVFDELAEWTQFVLATQFSTYPVL